LLVLLLVLGVLLSILFSSILFVSIVLFGSTLFFSIVLVGSILFFSIVLVGVMFVLASFLVIIWLLSFFVNGLIILPTLLLSLLLVLAFVGFVSSIFGLFP